MKFSAIVGSASYCLGANATITKTCPSVTRALRIMKLSALLILAACLQVSAKGIAQERVSISGTEMPLEKVFQEIKKQTGYAFFYSEEQMQKAKKVTINVKDETIKLVLEACLKDQPFTFYIDGKTIFIQNNDVPKSKPVLQANPIDISGKVLDEEGNPLTGANIKVKGTNTIATSNQEGSFSLKGIDEGALLEISFVGYKTKLLPVKTGSTYIIEMEVIANSLNEVVINKGYYSTIQKFNTGSVGKLTSKDIQKQPVSNVLAALEGRIPGLYIQQNSGVPGNSFTLRLRGVNSVRANGNDPLFIVDGVPFISNSLRSSSVTSSFGVSSSLNAIDPSQIESIEILKDADATAIYGSRGANGVILITTKKGTANKLKVDINSYVGFGKVTRTLKMLNLQQYLQMRHEAFANDKANPDPSVDYDLLSWDTTKYQDWQKTMIGNTAKYSDAQVSLSGGSANTTFRLSSGLHRETTVFPGDFADKRASINLSVSHRTNDNRFNAVITANYIDDNSNLPNQDLTASAVTLAPNTPDLYDAANKRLLWPVGIYFNPFSYLLQKYNSNTSNLIASATISYELIKNLKIQIRSGFNKMQLDEFQTTPLSSLNTAIGYTNASTILKQATGSNRTWIIEPQITYSRNLFKGTLDLLAGATFQDDFKKGVSLSGTGFPSDVLIENIQAATTVRVLANTISQYRYNAVFGRLGYNWMDKYLMNLTVRRDGSSRFGPGKQFGNFGAVGAAWILSREKLINELLPFISFAKLRTSYGITGNDKIDDYGFMDIWSTTTSPYQSSAGLQPNRLFNPTQAWETTKKFEAALDLAFVSDRIELSGAYYKNRSSNMLVPYPLSGITGFTSIPFYNLPATVQNTGWEFQLTGRVLNKQRLNWSISLNLAIPKNLLVSYPNIKSSGYANIYEEGKSLFVKKLFHSTGVDQQTGVYTYEDVDKDGKISIPVDFQAIKEITQKYYGGFQNTFNYRNFQFDIFFQFVKQTGPNLITGTGTPGFLGNEPTYVLDRWQKQGDNTNIQQFTQDYNSQAYTAADKLYYADNAIGDASFIRLKTVSIAYELSKLLKSQSIVRKLNIYARGQNLLTFTNYKGIDPENQSMLSLPPLKVITIGFQATF